ncbi:hypothetical protein M0802_001246 [Mischocyttarus mexicanus]|nr:hypothetical protein M0802_001246 [Mischocyttarus mexicanus]
MTVAAAAAAAAVVVIVVVIIVVVVVVVAAADIATKRQRHQRDIFSISRVNVLMLARLTNMRKSILEIGREVHGLTHRWLTACSLSAWNR